MDICWRQIDGHKIATISPAGANPNRHVVFFHGGAYNMGFLPMFTKFAVNVAKDNHCRVSIVDYPLAPEHHVVETRTMVIETYRQLCDSYPNDEMILCGDSAGAGLSLVLAQAVVDEGLKKPIKLVLISPWINADMDRDFMPYESMDVVLGRQVLAEAINRYRGQLDVSHPWLSPINGDLNQLGEVVLVAGSGEMFYPDLLAFKQALESADGNRVTWIEGEGLWHDWAYMDIPEAEGCRARLFAL
jgi:acetyl esterase/lipase